MALNVMELFAKIGLDRSDFNKGLSAAASSLKSFGSTITKMGSTAMKLTGAAIGAAATGVAVLTKASVDGYAEYEQMVGGVKKLYGNMGMSVEEYADKMGKSVDEVSKEWSDLQYAQNLMINQANEAYKTSGMSATRYMEVATSFSASLIQSLGGDTVKAAEQTDKAMQIISDNWNTFGGDMGMIQGAFQGFAKQNYMMLDNLKLGYGGTKTEMERLIADANEYAKSIGLAGDLSIDSFSDIIDAIDLIQKKQNIWGTTSREAMTTISGSLNMLSAAWDNLVTGFSNPDADIGKLIDNVFTALVGENEGEGVINQIFPAIERALDGIGKGLERLVPLIGEKIPPLIEQILPSLLSSATSLVQSFVDALPSILNIISEQLPAILSTIIPVAVQSLETIFTALSNAFPQILTVIQENIGVIANGVLTIVEAVGGMILQALPVLASAIEKGLPELLKHIQNNLVQIKSALTTILKTIGNLLVKLAPVIIPMVMDIGLELLLSLTKGITENADEFIAGVMTIIQTLIDVFLNPDTMLTILQCGLQIILAIVQGISNNIDTVLQAVWQVIESIIQFILLSIPDLIEFIGKSGAEIVTKVLPTLLTNIGQAGAELLEMIIGMIGGWLIEITSKARETFEGIGHGIAHAAAWIWVKVTELAEDVLGWIGDGLGDIFGIGVDLVKGLWNGITSVGEWIKEKITGFGSGITGWLKDTLGINSPSKVTAWMGEMLDAGLAGGVEKNADKTFRDIQKTMDDGMNSISLNPLESDIIGTVDVNAKGNPLMMAIESLSEKLSAFSEAGWSVTVPVSIGSKQIDEFYVDSKQRLDVRSGGQVNV